MQVSSHSSLCKITRRVSLERIALAVSTLGVDTASKLYSDHETIDNQLLRHARHVRQHVGDLETAGHIANTLIRQQIRQLSLGNLGRARFALSVFWLKSQLCLDQLHFARLKQLVRRMRTIMNELPQYEKRSYQVAILHMEAREAHNRHRFREAIVKYEEALQIDSNATLCRDVGSAYCRVNAFGLAADRLMKARDARLDEVNPLEAARCESLLAGLDAAIANHSRQTAKAQAAYDELIDIETRCQEMNPRANPLIYVQHRQNVLAALVLLDSDAAVALAHEQYQQIDAHGFTRQAFVLRKAIKEFRILDQWVAPFGQ